MKIFLAVIGAGIISISIEACGGGVRNFGKTWGLSFFRYTLVPSMTTKSFER